MHTNLYHFVPPAAMCHPRRSSTTGRRLAIRHEQIANRAPASHSTEPRNHPTCLATCDRVVVTPHATQRLRTTGEDVLAVFIGSAAPATFPSWDTRVRTRRTRPPRLPPVESSRFDNFPRIIPARCRNRPLGFNSHPHCSTAPPVTLPMHTHTHTHTRSFPMPTSPPLNHHHPMPLARTADAF